MEHQAVNSEAIKSIGYDEATATLEIKFTSGNVYEYFPVPPEIYAEFIAAESKGFYYNLYIRGGYDSKQI